MGDATEQPKRAGLLPVNNVELKKATLDWMDQNDHEMDDPETRLQTNRFVLALAYEAAVTPSLQNVEGGEWILFRVDEDGWVLGESGEYLVDEADRKGRKLAVTHFEDGEIVLDDLLLG